MWHSARHNRIEEAQPVSVILRGTLLATTVAVLLSASGLLCADTVAGMTPALTIAGAGGLVLWSWLLVARSHRLDHLHRDMIEVRDQTEGRRRELQTAIDHLSDGVLMLDAAGKVRVTNRRVCELLDLTAVGPQREAAGNAGAAAPQEDDAAASVASLVGGAPSHAPGPTRLERRCPTGGLIDMHTVKLPDGHVVATFRDVTEARLAEERALEIARLDPMTGVPNRGRFQAALADALACQDNGAGFALHMIDLDHFKAVNDTHGHAVGDGLLRAVAQRLARELRQGDVVARLGGDEFAVIQMNVGRQEHAEALGRRLVRVVSRPYDIEGKHIVVAASVGVALALADAASRPDLMRAADLALYEAKAAGRHTLRIYEHTMSERVERRRAIEADLRGALKEGQLLLHYQPIHRLADGSIVGFEALMRWQHPGRGLVPPSEFIPIAEESGLITELGLWALRTAAEEARRWPAGLRLAVNLSAVQLRSSSFVPSLRRALAATGIAPGRLEIEITESTILDSNTETRGRLDELKAMGIRMSMDDFGTGYSSLSYLRSFAFDKIKIDRSFVAEVDKARDCAVIIETIADLARRLAIDTTAEGIETQSQLEHLRRLGCTEGQGYHFSRPMPVHQLAAYLGRHGLAVSAAVSADASGARSA